MSTFPYVTKLINATIHSCLGLVFLVFIVTGCSSTSKIAQNAKGTVYLEEIMDWSFEASHPAIIDQTTILKIVKGVYTAEARMSAAGSKPMRVFSDEDAEFLAPLLAQGLSKAKPEQLVVFRLSSSAGSGSEPTAGSIYVQQGALRFTVSKAATAFQPESAARTEQAPLYATNGKSGGMTHVIDYHAMAKAPMPAALPLIRTAAAQTTGTSSAVSASASVAAMEGQGSPEMQVQLSRAKDMLAKKDTEIRVLRKESDWMKRELRERDEEIKALKATVKAPAKKKKAEAYRTH
jgi:hypothetical protein